MHKHKTTEGVYGPGTYTDIDFVPVSQDCRRLLEYLASITPGFTHDSKALEGVEFTGGDLPILPGPIKGQVLVRLPAPYRQSMKTDQESVCCHPCNDWYRVEGNSSLEKHRSW